MGADFKARLDCLLHSSHDVGRAMQRIHALSKATRRVAKLLQERKRGQLAWCFVGKTKLLQAESLRFLIQAELASQPRLSTNHLSILQVHAKAQLGLRGHHFP